MKNCSSSRHPSILIHLKESFWLRAAAGALAGMAGTMALQAIRKGEEKLAPDAASPIKGDPARFMVTKAREALPEPVARRVPEKLESSLAGFLPLGYGMTFGVLYSIGRSRTRSGVAEGALLGLLAWAVGYLGWLPRTRLMPPVWEHKPKQAMLPVVDHALYGLATVQTYRFLKHLASN